MPQNREWFCHFTNESVLLIVLFQNIVSILFLLFTFSAKGSPVLVPSKAFADFEFCEERLADFFEPVLSKETLVKEAKDLKKRGHHKMIHQGYHSNLFGHVRMNPRSFFTTKRLFRVIEREDDEEGYLALEKLYNEGALGPFSILRIQRSFTYHLRLDFVEGRSLESLLMDPSLTGSPELAEILLRYQRGVLEVERRMTDLGFSHDRVSLREPVFQTLFNRRSEKEHISFSISARNVLVESHTHRLVIIDPI